jgi:hypothetical protein
VPDAVRDIICAAFLTIFGILRHTCVCNCTNKKETVELALNRYYV